MHSPLSLASDTAVALAPLDVVVPRVPTTDNESAFRAALSAPLRLVGPTKDRALVEFVLPDGFLTVAFDTSADVPRVQVTFDPMGWDRLAVRFLRGMAAAAKANPKNVQRSLRQFAKLMDKLTDAPTGNGKIDGPRKVVIDRTMEQMAPGLRDELTRRVRDLCRTLSQNAPPQPTAP